MSPAKRFDVSRLESASRTHVGAVRTTNQDAVGESPAEGSRRVFVVADGMGGHAGGETASRLAIETTLEVFAAGDGPIEDCLRRALEAANERIYATQRENASLAGMGTTGVALGIDAGGAWVANVGDSRAYRLRGGKLTQLTEDHSVVAELERRGFITAEQALTHPRRNEVLRSLGTEPGVEVDLEPVELLPDDLLLLCSDGLSGVVREPKIASLLTREPLESAAEALIDAANVAGGPDNVTVQLVRVPADALKSGGDRGGLGAVLLAGALLVGLAVGWALLRA